MKFVDKTVIPSVGLIGRTIRTAIGKEGSLPSERFTLGFSHFSPDQGVSPPHAHAEEALIVLDAKGCKLHYGPSEATMNDELLLAPGMVISVGEGEWHAFKLEAGGFADLIFFYASVDNIRPENREGIGK